MQASTPMLMFYAVFILILLIAIGLFISTLRVYLRKMESKRPPVARPQTAGLSSSNLHESIQNQVLELQATETSLPEHETRFRNLVAFLKEAKVTLRAESAMLDLYILRLETLPHSDLAHLPTLAALFNWSQMRVKEILKTKT